MVTSLILFALLLGVTTALIVWLLQSEQWLMGVNLPFIIGYSAALLWTLIFDVYSVCVYGMYELERDIDLRG